MPRCAVLVRGLALANPRRWRSVLAGIAAVALVAPSCSSDPDDLPPPPATVDVNMLEYRFEHRPVTPPGRVVLQVQNVGKLAHSISIVSLPEDAPPIGEITRPGGSGPSVLPTFAALQPVLAGETAMLAVDFIPGRYGVICFVEDPDKQSHSEKGMVSELRVG